MALQPHRKQPSVCLSCGWGISGDGGSLEGPDHSPPFNGVVTAQPLLLNSLCDCAHLSCSPFTSSQTYFKLVHPQLLKCNVTSMPTPLQFPHSCCCCLLEPPLCRTNMCMHRTSYDRCHDLLCSAPAFGCSGAYVSITKTRRADLQRKHSFNFSARVVQNILHREAGVPLTRCARTWYTSSYPCAAESGSRPRSWPAASLGGRARITGKGLRSTPSSTCEGVHGGTQKNAQQR